MKIKWTMDWWFGEGSWWCQVFGSIFGCWHPEKIKVKVEICVDTKDRANPYCPNVALVEMWEDEVPDKECSVHKKPDPQPDKWTGEVCSETFKLPRKYCLHTVVKTFDTKPGLCPAHITPAYKSKVAYLQGHFLDWFNEFRSNCWAGGNAQIDYEYQMQDVLIELRKRRFKYADGFGWISNGKKEHKHLNYKAPWAWLYKDGKRVFDLTKWDERYWELFERFLRIFKNVGVEWIMCLFMREMYCCLPFDKNVNGVCGFWSPEARPYQIAYARKVCETYKKVYGTNYKPTIKIANEMMHRGKCQKFHDIMEFHADIFFDGLCDFITLNETIADYTGSEGCGAELLELGKVGSCPKPSCCYNLQHRHGKVGQGRKIWFEQHGVSTLTDAIRNKPKQSGGRPKQRLTEDAGGYAKDGKGIKWGNFVWGDATDTHEMATYIFTEFKKVGKHGAIAILPASCLKLNAEGVVYFDFHVDAIDWTRFDMAQQSYETVYENN